MISSYVLAYSSGWVIGALSGAAITALAIRTKLRKRNALVQDMDTGKFNKL